MYPYESHHLEEVSRPNRIFLRKVKEILIRYYAGEGCLDSTSYCALQLSLCYHTRIVAVSKEMIKEPSLQDWLAFCHIHWYSADRVATNVSIDVYQLLLSIVGRGLDRVEILSETENFVQVSQKN